MLESTISYSSHADWVRNWNIFFHEGDKKIFRKVQSNLKGLTSLMQAFGLNTKSQELLLVCFTYF